MKKVSLLTKKEIQKQCKKLDEWVLDKSGKKLSLTLTFESHVDALVFIARVTVHAEILQHHPDITFTYKKVKVVLSTHEVKGLTKKDFEFAQRIEQLQKKSG